MDDHEPQRLIASHLEALDDALIVAAERFGELLGGGRAPDAEERAGLLTLHRCLDHLCRDYAVALELTDVTADLRAGKIIGTAALFSIRARQPLGLLGMAPMDEALDSPSLGVVSGFGRLPRSIPRSRGKGPAGYWNPIQNNSFR
ncbi:hypothetical protein [Mycobacterium sp.]|uniref:hypothetical protein n=1 Tax=Mycobacterium sp. TaxID=1785 RepID=UPI002C32B6EC|nr:hypothetical protein [Mycobacterium sp.]